MGINADRYLKSFFKIELEWVADAEWQRKSWADADDELFGEFLMIIYQSSSVIEENRQNYKITDSEYKQIQKLYEMIEAFQDKIDYPTTSLEHMALLNMQEWQKIQRFARQTIDSIYPKLAERLECNISYI